MSVQAILWATDYAPTANTTEYAVLFTYAGYADPDGTNAYPSYVTVGRKAHCDPKTVMRTVRQLVARRLMARGDQSVVAHIPKNYRPINYDLLIPASHFADLDRVNQERADLGRKPLTLEARPPIAPAPPRKRRSDAKPLDGTDSPVGGDSQSLPNDPGGDSQSPPGGLTVPSEGTLSPSGGDSQSPKPVLDPVLEPKRTPSPTSVVTAEVPRARTSGGGGEGFIGDRAIEGETDPLVIRAVDVLAKLPHQLQVSADDRRELAHELAPRLAVGWSAEQLHERLAAKLPTDGIIRAAGFLAGRIRSLPDGPPPAPAPAPSGLARWSGIAEHDRRLGLGDQEPAGALPEGGWRALVGRQSPEVDA